MRNEVFTNNYWFNNENPAFDSLGVTWFLIAIFSLQILTLIFGTFAFLKAKIRIIPFVSSFVTVLLMAQVYMNVSGVGMILEKTCQSGYWLTCLSLFLFLGSFIFHLYSNREIAGLAKKEPRFLSRHRGKVVAAVAGILIAGVLAVAASTGGVGYTIKPMMAISEVIAKELDFNPYLHPISHILGEGAIRFAEDFINDPGVIRVSVGDSIIKTLSGSMLGIVDIMKLYVLNSTLRNIPYYLGVGEVISFGIYGIKKLIEIKIHE
jgi:hypothetical protein